MVKNIIKLFLILTLSGCSIPLSIVTHTNPEELIRQEELHQEIMLREDRKIRREQYEKMLIKHAKRVEKKIARKNLAKVEAAQERNKILKVFNEDQIRILKACEKTGMETFQVAKWLNSYGGSDLEEFIDYIYDNSILKNTVCRWALERGWRKIAGPFAEIRSAYQLLLKMEKSEEGL